MKYYLMIKEIEQTGLKYLCKRIEQSYLGTDDHLSYKGSGTLWRKILRKHPEYTLKTTVLGLYSSDELKVSGAYYSKLWNIVESKEWANLIPEIGDGGVTHKNTSPFIHESNFGRVIFRKLCPVGYIPYIRKAEPTKRIHYPITGEFRQVLLNETIPVGWVIGGPKGIHDYGPKKGECKVYNNGSKKVYIKIGDIVPDGFVLGLHYEGTTKGKQGIHNPSTGEKQYIQKGNELPAGFIVGLPATTGKHIQTPHGLFQTITQCMKELKMSRAAIFNKVTKDPINWYITNIHTWQLGIDVKTSIKFNEKKNTNE